jgi:hypothetical protein
MKKSTKIAGFFFIVLGWLYPFVGAGQTNANLSEPAKGLSDAKVTEDSPIYLRHGTSGRYLNMTMTKTTSEDSSLQHWNHCSGHCSGHGNHWSHHSHGNSW